MSAMLFGVPPADLTTIGVAVAWRSVRRWSGRSRRRGGR